MVRNVEDKKRLRMHYVTKYTTCTPVPTGYVTA